MTDKKTFGSFIRLKRTEKGFSQKELAKRLFISEGAISKWERGLSYPDITMISSICKVLEISEHELITASNDINEQSLRKDAHSYRIIRGAWFWVPTISYAIALVTCFICNLAVNGTLSWFFIALSALVCAYTFMPNLTMFFKKGKLLVFSVSTYLSICALLFTCAVYTDTMFWLLTAQIGVLIGYELVFLPILLSRTRISRFKFLISFSLAFVLVVLLLINVNSWAPFMLHSAILITLYAFLPTIFCTFICTFRVDAFIKTAVCLFVSAIMYYFAGHVTNFLFGLNENHYEIDFNNWVRCAKGNVHFICILLIGFIALVFAVIGIIRIKSKSK